MIANCPFISSLLLYVYGNGGDLQNVLFPFADFVKYALASPTFQPSLKSLRITCGRHLLLSPACIPFIRSLSRLELASEHAVEPTFWSSLTDSKIYLQALRINRLSRPAADYLTSYEGLEEFVFDHSVAQFNRPCGLTTVEEVRLFYHSILPKHRRTLRTLGLACVPLTQELGRDNNELWFLGRDHLEQVSLCADLEHLEILYNPNDYEDSIRSSIPLVRPFYSSDCHSIDPVISYEVQFSLHVAHARRLSRAP